MINTAKNKKKLHKKLQASIAGSIIIFLISFLVFCICAIDVGNTVTSRFKAQKITETIALYMTSYLASLPKTERTTESLDNIKNQFEDLYSDKEITGNYKFEIKDIQIKLDDNYIPKLKITTETSTPTLFLRYAGFGIIKIIQNSYAKSSKSKMPKIESDGTVYTFKSNEIITDKNGDDIKINLRGSYLVFAGMGNKDNISWIDIGSMSNKKNKIHYTISNTDVSYDASCITNGGTFNFTNDPDKTLGLIQYIRIIKIAACETPDSTPAIKDETDADDTDEPVVTILNTVKIISKKEFEADI